VLLAESGMSEKYSFNASVLNMRNELKKQVQQSEKKSNLLSQLISLRGHMALEAQKIYDEWQPNKDGFDEVTGYGGICDEISNALSEVIASSIEDINIEEGGQDGDDHAYLVVHDSSSGYVVDIPYYLYERGGGYNWKKIPEVSFKETDIVITPSPIPIFDKMARMANAFDRMGLYQYADTLDFVMCKVAESEVQLNEVHRGVDGKLYVKKRDGWYPVGHYGNKISDEEWGNHTDLAYKTPKDAPFKEYVVDWHADPDKHEMERYDQYSRQEKEWGKDVVHHLTSGDIETEQERKQKQEEYQKQYERLKYRMDEVQPLPETLYHVTSNKSKIMSEGLKTRDDLSEELGREHFEKGYPGLGGGPSDLISFTDNLDVAKAIKDSILEAHTMLNSPNSVQDMIEQAKKGSNAERPWIDTLYHYKGGQGGNMPLNLKYLLQKKEIYREYSKFLTMEEWAKKMGLDVSQIEIVEGDKPLVGGDGKARYMEVVIPMSQEKYDENVMDLYRTWSSFREHAGGPFYPLFWSPDASKFKGLDTNQVSILVFRSKPGAKGVKTDGLNEWRAHTGRAVKLVGEYVDDEIGLVHL